MAGQRRVIGGVLKVPLGDGWHAYAWTLPEVDFALFDLRSDIDMPAAEVVTHPFAFRVGVNGAAYLDGRWPRIGKVTPPPEVLAPVPTYIQDQFNGQFSIYLAGDTRPATRAEHWSGVLCGMGSGTRRRSAPRSLRRSPVQVGRVAGGGPGR